MKKCSVVLLSVLLEGKMMRKNPAVVILVGAMSLLLLGTIVEVSQVQADTVAFWTFNEKEVGQVAVDGDSVLDTSGSANVHDGFVVADPGDDVPYVEGVPGFSDGVAMSFERGPGGYQGQRTLSTFTSKDLHQEVNTPAGHATLHDVAFLAWMLLDQAQSEAT